MDHLLAMFGYGWDHGRDASKLYSCYMLLVGLDHVFVRHGDPPESQ